MDHVLAPYAQFEMRPSRPTLRRDLSNQTTISDVVAVSRHRPRGSGDGSARWISVMKAMIGMLLFTITLVCTVLSKLGVVSMTARLNVPAERNGSGSEGEAEAAVALYWQLLFIMILPHVVTVLRTLFVGILGKQTATFPWPTTKALLVGLITSTLEVSAISCLVFMVLSRLPTVAAILVMNGVFIFQAALESLQLNWCGGRRKKEKRHLPEEDDRSDSPSVEARSSLCCRALIRLSENRFSRSVAAVLQLCPLVAMGVYIGVTNPTPAGFALAIPLPLSVITLALTWSSTVQGWRNNCKTRVSLGVPANVTHVSPTGRPTARYKSNFINSALRIVLYPFISYVIFRYALSGDTVDPWCLSDSCSLARSFRWQGKDLAVFLVQIFSSFFGYTFMWISCTMVLHRYGLALPLYLSTPISVGVSLFSTFYMPVFGIPRMSLSQDDVILIAIAALIWVGQMLAKGLFLWRTENVILARDTDMFVNPHYDGVLLEQQAILNRESGRASRVAVNAAKQKEKRARSIFVCSTMYREDSEEMKQMLSSVYQLARYCAKEKETNPDFNDHFESHVFFDGGVNGTQLTHFALQLVSLLEESLRVDPKVCQPNSTPYGYRLSWIIEEVMPFSIHLKDSAKIKNKKRWSQVMYMNYVLNYRVKQSRAAMGEDNTFILTTDADIQFTPESALVLLDILDSDPQVGAVCARTHPKGSGPLYWYQVFDYAIGHWFLKVAEHILGTVLCCPGCFSVFRCRALRSVLDIYSTEVSSASEFLTKDMGEDRWLCTLLVENGWRLEYCAVSENYTHCPEGFDEFFKQRRRWIPSTVANLSLLITQASKITKGNDTVSILFVLFQGVLVFSTAISPATVILVIASGFASAYQVTDASIIAIIVILILLSVGYGILCLYGKPQHQLDAAKLATLVFAIVMGVVFAGNLKNIIYDLIHVGQSYAPCANATAGCQLSAAANATAFRVPLTPSTIYLLLFTLLFIFAGAFHFSEWTCLIHGVWYFLALPSGYLLLLIYSVANLDDRSWGTREASSGGQGGGAADIKGVLMNLWKKIGSCCVRGANTAKPADEKPVTPPTEPQIAVPVIVEDKNGKQQQVLMTEMTDGLVGLQYSNLVDEAAFKLTNELQEWLTANECPQGYAELFERHGYFNLHFVAGMTPQELQTIGLKDRGYILRLERAAQKLPRFHVAIKQTSLEPSDVGAWLQSLELQGYQRLFEAAGYRTKDDLENVRGMTTNDLQIMGICRRAHLRRLEEGIERLRYLFDSRFRILPEVIHWLELHECACYAACFEQEGYCSLQFVAGMKLKDFEAVGVRERGLALHLEKAAKKLPSLVLEKGIPDDVKVWLKTLHLEAYERVFASAGYVNKDDLESLKALKAEDLKRLGIHKRAHSQRLLEGISKLTYPTEVEERVHLTKRILEKVPDTKSNDEWDYWTTMLDVGMPLRPIAATFKSEAELKDALRSLRNTTLAVLLLVNIMWIVLLYTLQFPELAKYNLPTKAFEVLFLAVYALIVFVQFCAMIVHRVVTLIHYLARVEPSDD